MRRGSSLVLPELLRDLIRSFSIVGTLLMGSACFAGSSDDAVPYHVTVEMKSDLQRLLELHRSIRLDANEDYRSLALEHLIVSTGERIEGAWNTKVPVILIPGGVSDVIISHVRSDSTLGPDVIFAGGAETSDIKVIGGTGGSGTNIRVAVRSGAHLNRVELVEFGGLSVDQSEAGYVRNSTFARLLGYWPGPQVDWHGNTTEPSGANIFLGFSSITPERGSIWADTGDLALIGLDCESWALHEEHRSACFSAKGKGQVTVVGMSGGTSQPSRVGALASFEANDFLAFWMFHGNGGERDGADLLVSHVPRAVFVETAPEVRTHDDGASTKGLRAYWLDPTPSGFANEDKKQPPQSMGDDMSIAMTAAKFWPPAQTKPVRRLLSEPDGLVDVALSQKPDSSVDIQDRIDREGVIRLREGTYFLDRPLKIGSRNRVEGILGADRDRVVLVAKGDFAVIEGRGDFHPTRSTEGQIVGLTFDSLTLYGGRYGFNWTDAPGNFGDGGTIAFSSFANLKLMHQRIAAVNLIGIHGLDSNSWYRVDIADVPVAFRGQGRGMAGGMGYADKQSFVDCQFQNVSDTVWFWTSDRPSGNEIWKDDYFFQVGSISKTRSARSLLWANSVMENVSGPVGLQVTDRGATTTDYFFQFDCLWKGRGPPTVTDTQSDGIGTLFIETRFEQSGSTLISSNSKQGVFLWNSVLSRSVSPQNIDQGVFINSRFGSAGIQNVVIRAGASQQVGHSVATNP